MTNRSGLFGLIQNSWDKARHGPLIGWRRGRVGSITDALIEDLASASAVLADIRDENPNVYYEVALAHAFDTPVIPLVEKGRTPRFDITDQDAIEFETRDEAIENDAFVTDEIARRLGRLKSSPFRTAMRVPPSHPRNEHWMPA